MANMHLVTGYAGNEHVTAADQGIFNATLFGEGQYVLGVGNQFAASVVTNNLIRVRDGDLLMQGRHVRVNEGTYVDLAIENGTQGYMRNDLIVARYTVNSATAVEEVNLVVIKGANATSNPVDPAYTVGDLIVNHAIKNDMPLYRVPLNGLNVGELVPLFTVKDVNILDLDANKQDKTNLLGAQTAIADDDYFPFFDTSANGHKKTLWSNIKTVLGKVFAPLSHTHKKADVTDFPSSMPASDVYAWAKAATKPSYTYSEVGAASSGHKHAAADITSGILSAARGGTGVASIEALMAKIVAEGGCRIEKGSYVGTGTYKADNPCSLTFSFVPKLVIITPDYTTTTFRATFFIWTGNQYSHVVSSGESWFKVNVVTLSGTTLSWYCTTDAQFQSNESDRTYRYVALG